MVANHQIGNRPEPLSSMPQSLPRIAVVDDDDGVRRLLRNVFETSGYAVSEASSEAQLMTLLKSRNIALVTLDLALRHEDGLAIARAIRVISTVPIIMVTARVSDVDRIVGLEIGADDYITKPFNVREVLARVRAVLRRTNAQTPMPTHFATDIVCFGTWVLDLAAHELQSADGRMVTLTSAEFRLLETFVRHPGRVLSRDFLIDCVRGVDAEPLERAIDTNVSRLRRKLAAREAEAQIIKTVRGAGYMFIAKVRV
jgi:two-component system, OmpR family, response regulator